MASSDNQNTEKKGLDKSKFKINLCKNYAMYGFCDYADKCVFAHGVGELRRLPPIVTDRMCVEMARFGKCRFENKCRYPHSADEMKPLPVIPKPVTAILKKKSFEEEFPELPVKTTPKTNPKAWGKETKKETEVKLSDSELMNFTKEFLSPAGLNFADDDPNEEFNPEGLTEQLKNFMSRKSGGSLEERAKEIKILDLASLKDKDPVLFGYCVGILAGQKVL